MPICGVLDICDVENLWQWFRLELRLNTFRRCLEIMEEINHHHYSYAEFADHKPCGKGDIKLSIYHLNSHNHQIKGSCDIMSGFKLSFCRTSYVNTCWQNHVILWLRAMGRWFFCQFMSKIFNFPVTVSVDSWLVLYRCIFNQPHKVTFSLNHVVYLRFLTFSARWGYSC